MLIENYNKIAEIYFQTRKDGVEGKSGYVNREIERPLIGSVVPENLLNCKLLDVGCGPGLHLNNYQRRGGECFGVDKSEKMVELAVKNCPGVIILQGDAAHLPFEEGVFNFLTCSFLLDHIADIHSVLKEFNRVLKKSGFAILSVPHPIVHMFRNSQDITPSHSYYDEESVNYNIAQSSLQFVGYPRTFQKYSDAFFSNGFAIKRIHENSSHKAPDSFDSTLMERVPFICIFELVKI